MADTSAQRDPPLSRAMLQGLLDDRLLLSALACCGLLIAYQLGVILLQPPWIKPATDWLRTALAWPQLLVVAWVAVRLLRTHWPGAVAWCCAALGMLSYALARTIWTIADVAIYPHGVPFPSLFDLFFILQYPCFATALFLVPADRRWLPGVRTMLDGVLWMSAVTALSWYFVLLPMALRTGEPPLSKSVSMYYQVFDLLLFYGLVAALARPRRTTTEGVTISLLSVAVISLFVADTWAAVLLLHRPYTYRTGSPPDLFWFIFYLLVPLVALARLRLTPAELPSRPPAPAVRLDWREVLAAMRFVLPSVVVVGASMVILIHATVTSPGTAGLSAPIAVGIALLLLATLRPAVMFLEQEQLRHERDAARVQERALRLANERMETFLGAVAHELKTPLTSLLGNVQLIARRLDALLRLDTSHEDYARAARFLRMLVERCDGSLERMSRLVEDVLDETRLRQGRFTFRLEPHDLANVVGEAVEEQLALNPERTIHWVAEASPVPVLADASRIEQVVANYVRNALKFSRQDQAVEVCVCTADRMAQVSVHDNGVGIPLAEQPHIWDRFYQVQGVEVQSSSQIGVGIGLYISKAIIEGHQGQVGVESAPGQGTTIWFSLPLASPLAISSPEEEAGSPASLPVPCECKRADDSGNT
jgi:signal transduction histidine kinase